MTTLYGKSGNHRTNKLIMAAEMAGMDLAFVESDMKLIKSKDFNQRNPQNKIPVLSIGDLNIFESNAILKYIGSHSATLLGDSPYH